MVTKVEAIKKVIEEFGGAATWEQIYNTIEKYYPAAKASKEWCAGLRGVLYRELYKGKHFKRISLGIYALIDYKEEPKPTLTQKERMHPYIEGICLEIGNFEDFLTYTPDKSQVFKGVNLNQIATLSEIPMFTYPEIIDVVKNIDVIWFNKIGFKYPQCIFEVVDAIGTLTEALNRCIQLAHFNLNFIIIGPEDHKEKFENKRKLEPYIKYASRFDYKNYDSMIEFYEQSVKLNTIKSGFFKGIR